MTDSVAKDTDRFHGIVGVLEAHRAKPFGSAGLRMGLDLGKLDWSCRRKEYRLSSFIRLGFPNQLHLEKLTRQLLTYYLR